MLGNSARQCGGSTCEGRGSHRLTWSGMLENERSSAQLIFNKNNNNIKNKSNGKNNFNVNNNVIIIVFSLIFCSIYWWNLWSPSLELRAIYFKGLMVYLMD